MSRADGRSFQGENACSCGRPISAYAERCRSCNLRYQHRTGIRRWRVLPFQGPHTPETRAKIGAAQRGRKQSPETIARRVAADPRNFRLDEKPLRHFYLDQGLSCAAIARRLGCNRDTVRRARDRFGIPRRSKAEESRLRLAQNPAQRERLREGARRHNRKRWQDPTYRMQMSASISASNRRRSAEIAARNRARREDPTYREREDARLRVLSRRETKPWAARTLQQLRSDPAFESRRRTAQLASVRAGWLTGKLGPKGKVDYKRPDDTSVRLGSWAEAVVAFWLDMLRVPWDQPKRGLRLPNGRVYRPDFWLPSVQRYLEVKGGKDWEVRERAVHPGREPNIRVAQRFGVPVNLLEIKYPSSKASQDLTRAALGAGTVGGRPLREALVNILGLSPGGDGR